ncbi:macro domain-containing protein [Moritella sp. 24]|uniref:type II toxin-antitoxin system antitoxin DNA ADP-ribosyl glycohydrolase DarG n=1 Tax=Moritella sp. 24 TaxID=2746230 RepID=UPI001BAB766B|nr:macro domain-containing protein [Moritella sp. 24]QUM75543.1 macro domain-containing protein [Moritella sp. 24]
MIKYVEGNLLEAPVEALVNTVNTVGVMGKGIALMFKESFPKNMKEYAQACKAKDVVTGKMFVTQTHDFLGPQWIVNFPTKQHWRSKSKMEWIEDGLDDLRLFITTNNVKSIAIPPLGAGHGGLQWEDVKTRIVNKLSDLEDVEILIFTPTTKYQNVVKKEGVETLTPARAMIAELIRQYWVLGMECSLLEIQKLAWFLQRVINSMEIKDPLKLQFEPHLYGPYANNLSHLLNAIDGSYLKSDKRIPDASPLDVVCFDDSKKDILSLYLKTEAQAYLPALKKATQIIDGFESPFGMELLSTVDWLIVEEGCEPTLSGIRQGMNNWPAGNKWALRKSKLFDDRSILFALEQLAINKL